MIYNTIQYKAFAVSIPLCLKVLLLEFEMYWSYSFFICQGNLAKYIRNTIKENTYNKVNTDWVYNLLH